MAQFEVAAEEDAQLNIENQPAINKLKILPQLVEMLAKKRLQQEFLDHGVLSVLRTWLEPLPDGSLPNVNIRTTILEILIELSLGLENFERREQLRKSGLGKMIMFLSKSDEEIKGNKKLAQAIIDKWSRPIFNNSLRYEDVRDVDIASYQRTFAKKPVTKAARLDAMDDDADLVAPPKVVKSLQITSAPQRATLPEKAPLDFLVRPPSKSYPAEIIRAKKAVQDRQTKIDKIFRRMRAGKRSNLHALKLNSKGCEMCTI
ncbi:protein IWS1 homolog 1-like [Dioscorea cayenensis subsp. rotundata]|uniref:Protein IWS1 homolog 1-like n=1 Tax=Dioscorea cayennensis subsp. rotundata TaxID=55577 RepID=A0AB40D6B0_DIOCR|nr:protein IWS1 homolog 1-like [Dioscorea cayenensis subsp. rotundata]